MAKALAPSWKLVYRCGRSVSGAGSMVPLSDGKWCCGGDGDGDGGHSEVSLKSTHYHPSQRPVMISGVVPCHLAYKKAKVERW